MTENVQFTAQDAEIQAAIKAAQTKIAQIKAGAAKARQLANLNDDILLQAQAKVEIRQDDVMKLKNMIHHCKAIVESVEVFDHRTKQNKKWSNSSNFSFDLLTQLLTNLLGNVQYSHPSHRELMIQMVPVPETVITEVNELFNGNTRFSPLQGVILEGKAGKSSEFISTMKLVGSYLGVEFDLCQFNQSNLDRIEARARMRAERDQAAHEEAQELLNQALDL